MNDVQAPETDFWHVQLPTGDVRYWSLDELDEAFQRDEVDAKTFVLKEGEASWQRLGELLGLDEVPAAASPQSPSSFAPVSAINDFAGAQSIRPVVADLADLADMDDDDLAAAMKPKRKNLAAIASGAVLALALAIVGITHAAGGSDDKAAAAAPPPVAAVPAPSPVVAEAVAPQATLSDDQKRELLAADKAREVKAAAKAAANAKYHTTVRSYRAPKSGQVFHKGGNKYDPLNSAL